MDGNKKSSSIHDLLRDEVRTARTKVILRRKQVVEAGAVTQVLDMLLCIVDVAEASGVRRVDGAPDLDCCKAGGLYMGSMLVCEGRKGGKGVRWHGGWEDSRLMSSRLGDVFDGGDDGEALLGF
jgi:hypothetical protein